MTILRRFLIDRRAISSVEFALVVPLFLLFVLGTIDMSRAFWLWNKAEAATQEGVRTAAVSDIVANGLNTYDGVDDAGGAGFRVPTATINGGAPIVCTYDGGVSCTGTVGSAGDPALGSQADADEAFRTILCAMRRVKPELQASEVEVSYQHVGLGFAGNPFGPDVTPTVTVRIVNRTIDLITPGLIGLAQWPMPDFAATLTGEDFVGPATPAPADCTL